MGETDYSVHRAEHARAQYLAEQAAELSRELDYIELRLNRLDAAIRRCITPCTERCTASHQLASQVHECRSPANSGHLFSANDPAGGLANVAFAFLFGSDNASETTNC
jgi:hypothetical protein